MKKIIKSIIIFLIVFLISSCSKDETNPITPAADLFSDDFNDSNYTNNPQWDSFVGKGCAPNFGIVSVINGEFRSYQTGAGGCGNIAAIQKNLNITLSNTTKIKFDIKPVYSSVGAGAGWTNDEYPAYVELYLSTNNIDTLRLRFCYNYRGGSDTTLSKYRRVAFPYCTQNVWKRNEMFTLKTYFPNALYLRKIIIGGIGWDYEGYLDNISIY